MDAAPPVAGRGMLRLQWRPPSKNKDEDEDDHADENNVRLACDAAASVAASPSSVFNLRALIRIKSLTDGDDGSGGGSGTSISCLASHLTAVRFFISAGTNAYLRSIGARPYDALAWLTVI